MIQEQLAFLPEFLPDYRPFPPAKERTAWQGLPLRAKQRFLQAGEAALQTPIAPLPLSLWLDFTHTGRRTPWETAYFSRRARLCALVSAECVEHKGRFLDAIADTVWALCEESAWQLPAHNSYIRDTPQLPLPDTTRPIVDLFAAETGALLALTRYLLPDELDTAAPGTTVRMEQELDARILTPYFTSHFWWMGNGAEPMCNWTSWCTQNVLLTVFLLPTTQQQRQVAVKQAAYSLDCFLKDYGADGCCNEGAQYYRHAGLTLWGCLEILSNVAPQAFSPLFHEPKIKNIAEYICNVHVEGPYYLNFGDCSPLAGRCGAREYRFGQAVGSDALQALAAADFRADADPDHLQNPDGSTHINLWYRLTTAFAEEEMMTYSAAPRHHLTVWYPSVGVYAARQGSWAEAVQHYEKAVEAGSAEALALLGDCLYQGRGARRSKVQARRMWKKAAKAGEVQAMIALGDDAAASGQEAAAALQYYRRAQSAARGMPDVSYTPQIRLRIAQCETRYVSRKKALMELAEAEQGFCIQLEEGAPDAEIWLDETRKTVAELMNEGPENR